jgi:outer membrane protein OmpA-like peptidoglycan-associated protein
MTMRALWASLLAAVASAQSVDIQFHTIVPQGGQPGLVLVAQDDLLWMEVELKSSAFKLKKRFPATRSGQSREVRWKHAPGVQQIFGSIRSQVRGGDPEDQDVEFESVIATPLDIKVDPAKVDLLGGSITFTLNHPAGKAEITVRDEDTNIIAEDSAFYQGEPAGTPLVITWDKSDKKAARVDIKAFDKWEFFSGMFLIPWRADIPHEEVNFRLDSADIDASEQPKLDASVKLISGELRKLKKLNDVGLVTGLPPTPPKLYIAGHTDTLATAEYNEKLSAARARAIAGYFAKKGLLATIYWAGFGERHLLIKTADSVDEPRNRRVEYVVAAEQPYPGDWHKAQ